MKTSIIIRTLFRRDTLKKLYQSVKNLKNVEIITVTVKNSAPFDQVPGKLVYQKGEGNVNARNEGLLAAKGEIIVFLDDDCIPREGWLDEIVKIYEYDSKIGAVGGRAISHRENTVQRALEEKGMRVLARLFGDPGALLKIFPSGLLTDNSEKEGWNIQEVDHLPGTFFSIRREVVNKVGLFDEGYKGNFYREDTDYHVRIKKAGYKLVYTPYAMLDHYIGTTRRDAKSMYWKSYNHFRFWQKNFRITASFLIREFAESVFLFNAYVLTRHRGYLSGIRGKIRGFRDFYEKSGARNSF